MTQSHPKQLRAFAQLALCEKNTQIKAAAIRAITADTLTINPEVILNEAPDTPGRPCRPLLVKPRNLKNRSVGSLQGRAALLHALTHIEANAINLALDIIWRFPNMPEAFYEDWWKVAQEESLHFELLNGHLSTLGFNYGDFPAHDGLWEMAEKTKFDLLARLALVPRTLEARGLDATPAVKNRLVSVGDQAGAKILEVILDDEIGHVAIGNYWFNFLCARNKVDPLITFSQLARLYQAPKLNGPFNLEARRAAGFKEEELALLDK